jgi:hypothetical protein
MDYAEESLRSRKYLSLEQALDISGLTLPELRRAMALSFVRAVEIGNTSFVEHLSLKEYLERKSGESSEFSSSNAQSMFFPDEPSLDEDNHSNQKEREMFQKALERDSRTASQLATTPYAAIALLILFALTLALPISQTVQTGKLSSAQSYFTNAHLKEVTAEKVETLLVRANTTQQNVIDVVGERVAATERKDYFATYQEQQRVSALDSWFGAISEGIDALALGVYETIEGFIRPSK